MNEPGQQLVEIVIPSLGCVEMRISVWFAEPGDRVYAGDRLVEVIAAGVTFDVSAPVTGRLADQTAFPNDIVVAGQVVGAMMADAE